MRRRLALAVVLGLLAVPAATHGQGAQQVRLAASSACPTTPGCALGLKRVYKLDPTSLLVTVPAGEGIGALDEGSAQVGVAFSTNPGISRPDILTLRDDKHMIGIDNIVPIIRRASAARAGRAALRRLDAASRLLTTLQLRDLNQQVIDGRQPAAVGASFVDDHGLARSGASRKKATLVVGFMDFAENEVLANIYAETLRAAGYRVRVKSVGGLRPEVVAAMKKHTIDLYPGYARSLADYLTNRQIEVANVRPQLTKALAKIGARAARFAPGSDTDVYVMKRSTASALGIAKISDLARYWPAVT
jgi:glycine betaine/choline ABC-type transport system substrate-binding protein